MHSNGGNIWWYLPLAVTVAGIAALSADQVPKSTGVGMVIGGVVWMILGKHFRGIARGFSRFKK